MAATNSPSARSAAIINGSSTSLKPVTGPVVVAGQKRSAAKYDVENVENRRLHQATAVAVPVAPIILSGGSTVVVGRPTVVMPLSESITNKENIINNNNQQQQQRVKSTKSTAKVSKPKPFSVGKQQNNVFKSTAVAAANNKTVLPQQPLAVARRNARERNRVKQVNNGFAALRQHIPDEMADAYESHKAAAMAASQKQSQQQADISSAVAASKKLSKVETLRMAVEYIRNLEHLLNISTTSAGDQNFSFCDSSSFVSNSPSPSYSTSSALDEEPALGQSMLDSPDQATTLPLLSSPAMDNDGQGRLPSITTINGIPYFRIGTSLRGAADDDDGGGCLIAGTDSVLEDAAGNYIIVSTPDSNNTTALFSEEELQRAFLQQQQQQLIYDHQEANFQSNFIATNNNNHNSSNHINNTNNLLAPAQDSAALLDSPSSSSSSSSFSPPPPLPLPPLATTATSASTMMMMMMMQQQGQEPPSTISTRSPVLLRPDDDQIKVEPMLLQQQQQLPLPPLLARHHHHHIQQRPEALIDPAADFNEDVTEPAPIQPMMMMMYRDESRSSTTSSEEAGPAAPKRHRTADQFAVVDQSGIIIRGNFIEIKQEHPSFQMTESLYENFGDRLATIKTEVEARANEEEDRDGELGLLVQDITEENMMDAIEWWENENERVG